MDFGVREVVAEAPQALLAAPEMAPEMELEWNWRGFWGLLR